MVKKKVTKTKLKQSRSEPEKFKKDFLSKEMNQGWHYYKLYKNNIILAVRLNLTNISQVVEKGGQPVINKVNKSPIFEWSQFVEHKFLTKEQYDDLVESGFDEDITGT